MKASARTEGELLDLLAARYPAPRHAFLPHVRNATGWRGVRTADAVVLQLWPSDGLHLIGFELKSSRSDWLREVKRPVKREAVAQFCDAWVVVAGAHGIVRLSELPPGAGLLEVGERGLLVVQAPADCQAKPVERDFMAALVRRALTCSPHGKALEARARELADERISRALGDLRQARVEAQLLRRQVERLEAAAAEQRSRAGGISADIRIISADRPANT